MRRLCVLLLVLFSTYSFAQDSKRTAVEELMALTQVDSMLDTIYSQMGSLMQGMGQQLGVQASEQEVFDRHMEKVSSIMKAEMSWEKMKEPMIDLYLKHYSEKEIRDMVAFYKSDTGRSMMEKMPAVMADSMRLSQTLVQGFLPKLQQLNEEFKAELLAARGK